jgi:signal peptidase II
VKLGRAAFIAGLVVLADQLSKAAIALSFPFGWERELIPGLFRLVHTRNRGVAFSLLADSGRAVQIGLLVVVSLVVAFIIWQLARGGNDGLASVGLSLVLGGAVGNLIDRVVRGEVIDFLDFFVNWGGAEHHWPAFNVADSAISVGAGLVILAEIVLAARGRRAPSTD